MATLPTGTVTFLFTDIEGSTRLALEHPDGWESMRGRHDAILRGAIESHAGYIFQSVGDGFCAAFRTAGDALRATVEAQSRLHSEEWGPAPVRVRMGIHTGKADVHEDGDYHGYLTLSRVQRLMSSGHGGQILVSLATQQLLRDDLPDHVSLRDLGEHRLKDLVYSEHIYQVDSSGLPVDFPPLRTLDIQLNNLPAQTTHFIGREREIAAVLGLLRNPGVRLVTLTGAGGTGKTRLSLQVAADLLDEYEHGIWFVELASISDPELFLPAVASALKVKESAGMPVEQTLNDFLHDRSLLLVLDNFEQIVAASPGISSLLNAAPRIKVLVSSREVLRLRGEHDYPVPPLGLPESSRKRTAAVLAQYEAIALFVQHAQAASPSFVLDDGNADTIARICAKLDGLPLALELAAARSRLLKPEVMLEKLSKSLDTLTGGARDLPRRQQTIRAAIDWSYDLLDEPEKALFARLAVFAGGWTLESAEAVCGPGLSISVMGGVESLLDKSLLREFDAKSGGARFTMLETVRAYASEKLAQSGELPTIREAHARYMDQFLEKIQEVVNSAEEGPWFAKLDDELDNLRSAVEWTMGCQQSALAFQAGGLYAYWNQRTNYREPLSWLERGLAMDAGGIPAERALALKAAGNFLMDMDEAPRARRYYESALDLFRKVGDSNGITMCMNNLGNIAWKEKDFEKARSLYEQCLALGTDPGSFGHAMLLNNLGSLAMLRGDWQASLDYYTRSREMCQRLGADAGVSYADWFLGRLALVQRKLDEAEAHFQSQVKAGWLQANPLMQRYSNGYLGYVQLLRGKQQDARRILNDSLDAIVEYLEQNPLVDDGWLFLEGQARLELGDGRAERAAQLFGAAWTQRGNDGLSVTEAERPDYEACIAETRAALGDAAFDRAFSAGKALTLKEAFAFAAAEVQS